MMMRWQSATKGLDRKQACKAQRYDINSYFVKTVVLKPFKTCLLAETLRYKSTWVHFWNLITANHNLEYITGVNEKCDQFLQNNFDGWLICCWNLWFLSDLVTNAFFSAQWSRNHCTPLFVRCQAILKWKVISRFDFGSDKALLRWLHNNIKILSTGGHPGGHFTFGGGFNTIL